jgi:hypothetical protein
MAAGMPDAGGEPAPRDGLEKPVSLFRGDGSLPKPDGIPELCREGVQVATPKHGFILTAAIVQSEDFLPKRKGIA